MTYTILIVLNQGFDPNSGGVQRSTYKISSYFKDKGHNIHVFSYQNYGHTAQNVATLHYAMEKNRHKNEVNNNQLIELIDQIKPDVVINQKPYATEIGEILLKTKREYGFLLLGCLRNTLFSVKLNLNNYIDYIVSKPFRFLFNNKLTRKFLLYKHRSKHRNELKFILDTYDYFVMFGPPNISELKYFVGDYKLEKTYLIPNSILDVESEFPNKEKRILWLSRLSYKQKRADLILPLWKKVMHQLPDWHFDVVGEGDAFEDLNNQIKEEQIPRIKLYGKREPYKFYKRSTIYIMTSEYEGFPNTLIEAQAYAAIPIVYDNYPICSWVLNEGESGILIKPFDVSKMANEVVLLANDKNNQRKMMKATLSNAKKFHIKEVGIKWLELFDSNVKKQNKNQLI